ncbi:hypothetical protein [Psychromonas aquimarina]|uniref:hypothetical protein n=1 Tax=Psychromonas aquimarina TaxID=444919 RepID=UPI00040C1168|nr:hypothetical protein [Psychromonas aquimarina]
MLKFKNVKSLGASLLCVLSFQAAADNKSSWVDFSDPTAIYSRAGVGVGTEGVDVYGAVGGYLGGQFKQQLSVEAKHDLDYYNVNYFAFNTANDTGFSFDTRWADDYDQASVGVIKKIPLAEQNIIIYPSMNLGLMWGDNMSSTTYIEIDAAVRYSVNRALWFGATPSYKYAVNGIDINDLDITADVGYQVAKDVALSAHLNNDGEVWADFTFAF